MDQAFNPELSEVFLTVAVSRNLLTIAQAETLRRESTERSQSPAQIAIETGVLDPLQTEIVAAFAAPHDLAPGYELLDVLGSGALGVVYRARQPHLKRDVAIKAIIQSRLIEQNVMARFQQEGAAIGRLQHPNIVGAFDSGSHQQRLYLVMELVRGTDLRKRISRDGPIDVRTALHIVRQTASGLAHALSHHIIHRDIKPGNLMLTDAPAGFDLPPGVPLIKIADFGLARFGAPADPDEATQLTLTGSALGTPMYCAPEQLSGDSVDHRADVYALGATLVNMLAGRAPFSETNISKLIAAKLTGTGYDVQALPPDLPPAVRELIDSMLAHDPNDRIDPYETLIDRIDQILASIGSPEDSKLAAMISSDDTLEADSASELTTPSGTAKRSRRALVLLGLATILALGVTGFMAFLWPRLFPPPEPVLVQTAWHVSLFDGKSLVPWKPSEGTWRDGQDEELSRVLVGNGVASRTVPPVPAGSGIESAVAFSLEIDLRDAEAAEVHFGHEGDLTTSNRIVFRYSKDAIEFGTRQGIDGPFDVGDRMTGIRHEKSGPDYHSITAELHGDHWFVYWENHDRPFASIRADADHQNRTLQLAAIGGDVFFADLLSLGLRDPGEKAPDQPASLTKP